MKFVCLGPAFCSSIQNQDLETVKSPTGRSSLVMKSNNCTTSPRVILTVHQLGGQRLCLYCSQVFFTILFVNFFPTCTRLWNHASHKCSDWTHYLSVITPVYGYRKLSGPEFRSEMREDWWGVSHYQQSTEDNETPAWTHTIVHIGRAEIK